jgi:hypothetical protein
VHHFDLFADIELGLHGDGPWLGLISFRVVAVGICAATSTSSRGGLVFLCRSSLWRVLFDFFLLDWIISHCEKEKRGENLTVKKAEILAPLNFCIGLTREEGKDKGVLGVFALF